MSLKWVKNKTSLTTPYFNTAQKMETVDLVTFTEEILNEKIHFLCSAIDELCVELQRKSIRWFKNKYEIVYREKYTDLQT